MLLGAQAAGAAERTAAPTGNGGGHDGGAGLIPAGAPAALDP